MWVLAPRFGVCFRRRSDTLSRCMETDPKKLREIRLNQPRRTSEEAYRQMEMILRAANRSNAPRKPESSALGRSKQG